METHLPLPKRGRSPQFSAHVCCGQMAACIKMPLGMKVCLSPSDFVLDGTQVLSPKNGQSPKFSAHFYCGQTAGWIKMPLGTEVGLAPGDSVLDGDPVPPKKGAHTPPNFLPMSIMVKRLYVSGYHLIRR